MTIYGDLEGGLEHAQWAAQQSKATSIFQPMVLAIILGGTLATLLYYDLDLKTSSLVMMTVGFWAIGTQFALNHAANSYGFSLFFDEVGSKLSAIREVLE